MKNLLLTLLGFIGKIFPSKIKAIGFIERNINPITSFLAEIMVRFQSKSPKLFIRLQWFYGIISTVLALIISFNETTDLGLGNIIIYRGINLMELLVFINSTSILLFAKSKLPVEDNTIITDLKKQD
jgi:hypothetical protein